MWGSGTRTPASCSRYSASTSVFFHSASRPNGWPCRSLAPRECRTSCVLADVARAALEAALRHVLVDLRTAHVRAAAHHVHGRLLAAPERAQDFFVAGAVFDQRLQSSGGFPRVLAGGPAAVEPARRDAHVLIAGARKLPAPHSRMSRHPRSSPRLAGFWSTTSRLPVRAAVHAASADGHRARTFGPGEAGAKWLVHRKTAKGETQR